MRTNKEGLAIIKEFEGFRAKPYLCPAGVPTIGYGTTRYPNGRRVDMADPEITEKEALLYLTASVERVEGDLRPLIRVPVTSNQWSALVSLAYNIGVGARDGKKGDLADSTLLDHLNAGNFAAAAEQFLKWNKARVRGVLQALAGLTRRRGIERALFLKPDGA